MEQMNYEIVDAFSQIVKDKEIEKDFLLETVKAGLEMAARKKFGPDIDIDIEIDYQKGNINIYRCRTVVKRVTDKERHISRRNAEKLVKDSKEGDVIREEVSFFEFGRTAIQTAKQIIIQKIREKEREKIFENYQNRIGEIVTGTIQQIDRGNLIINLGKAEAIIPREEQIRRERFLQGDTIRAYLMRVEMTGKGPQIVLSRTHPGFLEELFKLEVPEIFEGIVKVKSIARDPGERSKIAVTSMDDNIDAVGACVGMKGSRVQDIVRELSGERIDVVSWSSDTRIFVTKALSPAKVVDVLPSDEADSLVVVVKDENLSQAIGKAGQNAKLASRLTGLKIDILSESEYQAKLQKEKEMEIPLSGCEGLGKKLTEKLGRFGYETVQEVLESSVDDLLAIPGIGQKTVEKLLDTAARALKEKEEEREREMQAEGETETDAETEADEASPPPTEAEASPETESETGEEVEAETHTGVKGEHREKVSAEGQPVADTEAVPEESPEAPAMADKEAQGDA
jgi:N utilization substance protein A